MVLFRGQPLISHSAGTFDALRQRSEAGKTLPELSKYSKFDYGGWTYRSSQSLPYQVSKNNDFRFNELHWATAFAMT